ncbi:hypothetical protein SDRG_17323 [Saprolegnia diclina VS20]|uniref:PLAC8 family protein n=1 Tax=Saprolegnia diclina (strain VS20) TaxID=1156394 RepID=T0QYF0_SAPDV|nr:hypothetical protein SDRG_17323 [Saprolegnia diclina VS20]EQC24783.1 hypothetical protein SDRG_17323 [Saprolegnia diclina VS20]|eukprot:XP_008621786.1 hypothetical protein SDRG_17323 [Saprolegnia diclina VS20]
MHSTPQHDSAPQAGSYNDNAAALTVGKWEAGIFGCFSSFMPNCLMATCCPCVSLAQTTHRLGLYSYSKVLLVYGIIWVGMAVCSALANTSETISIVECVLFALGFLMLFQIRTKVRTLLQIPGSQFEDCFYSLFCGCCALAQMATQAKAYDAGKCSFGAKDTLPAYNMA